MTARPGRELSAGRLPSVEPQYRVLVSSRVQIKFERVSSFDGNMSLNRRRKRTPSSWANKEQAFQCEVALHVRSVDEDVIGAGGWICSGAIVAG